MNWLDSQLATTRTKDQDRRSSAPPAPVPEPSLPTSPEDDAGRALLPAHPLDGDEDLAPRPLDDRAVPVARPLTGHRGGGGSLLARIERILLERLEITEVQLEEARRGAALRGMSVVAMLVELGMLSGAALAKVKAELLHLEYIELAEATFDASAIALLPEVVARRYSLVPMAFEEDGRLRIATAEPQNVMALDDVRTITKRAVKTVVASQVDIDTAINRLYRLDQAAETLVEEAAAGLDAQEDDLEASLKSAGAGDAPIIKLVNMLITQAVNDRASDIHIEPGERELRVRYRIDGVLHERMRPPKSVQAAISSRLKIMADIDIAERRIPQDGRISVVIQGKAIDIRVATLPTVFGEKIVMRILDKSSVMLDLADLGFRQENFVRFEQSFKKPYGMILVTGPTGSGKSTTLYATLNILNREEVNCITVEDPVEYRLRGVNQVGVNPKAGLTFASALRSILRADPDIILIGEIRDQETAKISVEAALTGHLVLATLHTNDAPSAVTRLIEMGIEPFLVASGVDCVLAQRLARRLCDRCKEPYTPTEEELTVAGFPFRTNEPMPRLYRAGKCPACGNTGYKSRTSLHEVMTVTEEIERLVVEKASAEDISRMARSQGMQTLRDDGFAKMRQGVTSLEEVLRVVA
ncbi:N/A [soil metagenome]